MWRPPPPGKLKVNIDASYNKNRKIGTAGIIVRNHLGDVVSGHTKKFPICSPLLAEACALREGVVLALNLGMENVLFESDSLMLIKACRREEVNGEVQNLVADILYMKQAFQSCGFTWVARSGNGVAHLLASLASRDVLPGHWRWRLPDSLKTLVDGEKRIQNSGKYLFWPNLS